MAYPNNNSAMEYFSILVEANITKDRFGIVFATTSTISQDILEIEIL